MPKKFFIREFELATNYTFHPYNSSLKDRARFMRKHRNLPEVLFWSRVQSGKFHGLDFDRQRIIGNYIVDFYCKALSLIVEIDGISHENQDDEDLAREEWLVSRGCRVIRFTSTSVKENISQVLTQLEEYILNHFSDYQT
jgi:very-short-patch-repair endonuclease